MGQRFERIKAAAERAAGRAKAFRSLPKVLRECRRRKSYYPLAQYLLELYKERGEMFKLSVDSANKQMEVEILLKGQEKAIQVVAKDYELTESDSNVVLALKDLETNQHWANVILRTFGITEQRFTLPEKYAELIQLAL